jgi:hypothetical protein
MKIVARLGQSRVIPIIEDFLARVQVEQ